MAENWSAYEAAKELYGNNVENIQDIGSRFPLFSRLVVQIDNGVLLDVLAAIPKVTARMMETGLKTKYDTMSDGDVVEAEADEKPVEKEASKSKKVAEDEDDMDYASMTAKDLYALCCARGLSGKCKKRNKDFLISVLEAADEEKDAPAEEGKKPVKKTEKEKAKAEEPEDDDWGDDEEETEKDPYEGKGAVELFKMCKKRGIATKPKLKSAEYIRLLKKADEAENEPEEDDEDDEWEI